MVVAEVDSLASCVVTVANSIECSSACDREGDGAADGVEGLLLGIEADGKA